MEKKEKKRTRNFIHESVAKVIIQLLIKITDVALVLFKLHALQEICMRFSPWTKEKSETSSFFNFVNIFRT